MTENYSIFSRYKAAERYVFDWLRKNVLAPELAGTQTIPSAGNIWAMTKAVCEKVIPVPSTVISCLEMSTRLRKKAAKACVPDEGHAFFLALMLAVKQKLTPLMIVPTMRATVNTNMAESKELEDKDSDTAFRNRFAALALDTKDEYLSSESSADDDDDYIDLDAVETAVEQASKDRAAEEHMRKINYQRLQALCFLFDLDMLMQEVVSAWRAFKNGSLSLLAATAATNTAVRIVQHLAAKLQLKRPHLKTLTHIMTLLQFHPILTHITWKYPHVSYEEAVDIVSKHRVDLAPRKLERIVSTLAKELRTSFDEAKEILLLVISRGEESLQWSPVIGGTHSILRTETLLTKLLPLIAPGTKLQCTPGFFGKAWDEKTRLATSTTDLMEFLMSDVMPVLIINSQIKVSKLENEETLMPVLPLVTEYVTQQRVSFPLVFALQSLLHAVLAVQGDNMCARIRIAARVMLERLQKQLKERRDAGLFFTDEHNLQGLDLWIRVSLDRASNDEFTRTQVDRALFNPYMAGQYLAMATLGISLHAGLVLADSAADSRLILHLYHAMRVVNVIDTPIMVLEFLSDLLSKSKSLWVGDRPQQCGAFLKGFMLSFGYDCKSAGLLPRIMRGELPDKTMPGRKVLRPQDLRPVVPKDISRAFRYMARGDFEDILPEDPVDVNFAVLIRFITQAVNDESDSLAVSLIAISTIMRHLRTLLVNMPSVKTRVRKAVADTPGTRDTGWEIWFLQPLLAACDLDSEQPAKDNSDVIQAAILIKELAGPVTSKSLRLFDF